MTYTGAIIFMIYLFYFVAVIEVTVQHYLKVEGRSARAASITRASRIAFPSYSYLRILFWHFFSLDFSSRSPLCCSILMDKAGTRLQSKTALVFGEESYTYEQLDKLVDGLATALLKWNVQAGDRVAF